MVRRGRAAEAIANFESAVAVDDSDGDAWFNLARGGATLGGVDEAVDAFDRCLALGPTFAAVVGRAEALAALGRHEEAAAAAAPPRARAGDAGHVALGYARLRTGDAPGAAAALRAAADAGDGSRDDGAAPLRRRSTRTCWRAGRPLRRPGALPVGPGRRRRRGGALQLRAAAAAERRRRRRRRRARARRREPAPTAAHNALGLALLQRGDAAGAEPHLAKTSDLAPGDSERSYNVGVCLLKRGRPAAERRFRASRATRPTSSRAAALATIGRARAGSRGADGPPPPPAAARRAADARAARAPADAALPVYAYARLKAPGPYPADVRAGARELHLSDDEFAAVFAVSKADFLRQPKWKQDNKKKQLGLF
ncbi:protein N-acetylglucosaminyltransferase [Aureococcus anophagefferens]|uniref:Protein N-acetylglucosaminyltransferase n=1 Tax=Aureococcus anophagefferens TaxID=44056 RepID=A0ABR1G013_AURAN